MDINLSHKPVHPLLHVCTNLLGDVAAADTCHTVVNLLRSGNHHSILPKRSISCDLAGGGFFDVGYGSAGVWSRLHGCPQPLLPK